MLGAYYYPWYGKSAPPVLGIGDWKSGYTDNPILGEYDCQDSKVIANHLQWAKEAGIDFFAVEWLGLGTFEDEVCKKYYLPALADSETKFCIFYDSSFALNKFRLDVSKNQVSFDFQDEYLPGKTKGDKFLEDFYYLVENYFNHPRYLKIDNRPVVIIYNTMAFRNNSEYFDKLLANIAKREIKLFLVADAVYWPGVKISKNNLASILTMPPKETIKVVYRAIRRFSFKNYEKDFSLSKYFSGITSYNMYTANRTKNFLNNIDELYQKFHNYANAQDISFIPNVMPGYDDRKLKKLSRPILERENGEFYRDFWKISAKYIDPEIKMILITSFNEWHEGTEIEPSKEYGKDYIKLTKSLID